MSQCDQLAALLSDGEWWTTRDLLREVPCIVHSRVAELRKRGLEIEHDTTGPGAAGSRYRLVDVAPVSASDLQAATLVPANVEDGEASGVGNEPGTGATFSAEPTSAGVPQAPDATAGPNGEPQASPDASQASSALTPRPGHGHPSPPAVAGAAQLSLDGIAA